MAGADVETNTAGPSTDPLDWTRLMPPPRPVPAPLRAHLQRAQLAGPPGYLGGAGVFLALLGLLQLLFGSGPSVLGLGLMGVGLTVGLLALTWSLRRCEKTVRLLQAGYPTTALVTQVWDQNQGRYRSHEEAHNEWAKFRGQAGATFGAAGRLTRMIARQLRNWPCKVQLLDGPLAGKELAARLHLGRLLLDPSASPQVTLLCDPRQAGSPTTVSEGLPGLSVTPDGQWAIAAQPRSSGIAASFFRSFIPVIGTYALAAYGVSHSAEDVNIQAADIPPAIGVGITLLFTLTHAVVPVFFYVPFMTISRGLKTSAKGPGRVFHLVYSGFIHLHMAFWFGAPMLVLAAMTSWLAPLWAFVHIVIARRGTRRWVFLEYGSTSLALLLFLFCVSATNLYPLGLIVIAFQSLLLTVADWKGRGLWIGQE